MEEWRDIPGWEGLYQASSEGQIRSLPRLTNRGRTIRGRVLSPGRGKGLYYNVALCRDGKPRSFKLHILVALAFHGERPGGMDVMHLDNNPENNAADNLRYGTKSENCRYIVSSGRHEKSNRENCPRGHNLAKPNLVKKSAENGHRACLACDRASSYVRYHPHLQDDESKWAIADQYYERIMEDKS